MQPEQQRQALTLASRESRKQVTLLKTTNIVRIVATKYPSWPEIAPNAIQLKPQNGNK